MILRLVLRRGGGWSVAKREWLGLLRTCSCGATTNSNFNYNLSSSLKPPPPQLFKVSRRGIRCGIGIQSTGKTEEATSTTTTKEFKQFSRRLTENVWTFPNLLCVVRMGMAPLLGYAVINEQYGAALGLFVVAGATDLADGWIARVVPGQSSVMGSFLDPMADKILVGFLFISLTYMDLIPVALTGLIISRDALLIAAGFYIRYKSLDPPRTLARYFDYTSPTAQLAPTFISKVNTGIQLGLIATTLVSAVLPYDIQSFLTFLWYTTATTTVCSGLSYLFAKNTYKFLRRKPKVKSGGVKGHGASGDKSVGE